MARDVGKRDISEPPTLLSLPPHLRHRIYLRLGVARHDGTDGRPYTYYLDGRKEPREIRIVSASDPPPARNFAGLLLSCRALYVEVATLLYSANRFVMIYQASLEPLHALSPTAVAALTSLKVVLNESSCHQAVNSSNYPPDCCCDDPEDKPRAGSTSFHCAEYHGSMHRRPLPNTSTEPAAQAILATWRDAAAYLSSYVSAGRLALSLVCDLDDGHEYTLEAAQLAIAPLALFPPLKDCHVRLGKRWNRPLQRLAESAVLQACPNASPLRIAPAKVPSALISLPPELRLRILQYTDLITPWSEVTWSRQYPRYQATPYSALPPIHYEATDPETACTSDLASNGKHYPYRRLTAAHFVREAVPVDCLAHLRFLELVFPPFAPRGWPVAQHPAMADWFATVDWLRGKVNAPALTIRVVFADMLSGSRRELTKEQGTQIVRGYKCILYPFRSLLKDDGLAALYVQAAHPWAWDRNAVRYMRLHNGDGWLEAAEQELKAHLERLPGCEAIVDARRTKPEPRKSVWQRWYDVPLY